MSLDEIEKLRLDNIARYQNIYKEQVAIDKKHEENFQKATLRKDQDLINDQQNKALEHVNRQLNHGIEREGDLFSKFSSLKESFDKYRIDLESFVTEINKKGLDIQNQVKGLSGEYNFLSKQIEINSAVHNGFYGELLEGMQKQGEQRERDISVVGTHQLKIDELMELFTKMKYSFSDAEVRAARSGERVALLEKKIGEMILELAKVKKV